MYILARMLKKMKPKAIKKCSISKKAKVEGGTQIIDSSMDRYSFCGYDCVIINTHIGAFCSIASNVKIGLLGHPLTWVSTSCAFYKGKDSIDKDLATLEYEQINNKTIIGNDVWIGENALIKAGVSIGNGAVVGMGSVVVKNIGEYEIWAGNPARFIRKRFDEKTISELRETQWWDMDESRLHELSSSMNLPEKFIDKAKGK